MSGNIKLYGVFEATYGKAHKFMADYWEDYEFLPASQCWFERDPLAEEPGRGWMTIPGWLAKKNNWSETGEA